VCSIEHWSFKGDYYRIGLMKERAWLRITFTVVIFVSTQICSRSFAAADFGVPMIDLTGETDRQVIVDRERGQYLGHVTTVLLEDNKTIVATYPKGHGKGGIVMKRSIDGGKTWSERLPVPENWSTSREVPTIHRVIDAAGTKRLILFSGLYPCRMAVSEDDGNNWTPLNPVGDWGGIVTMGSVEALKTGAGHYLALFHDDGRYCKTNGDPDQTDYVHPL
jgi:hypothetical protein